MTKSLIAALVLALSLSAAGCGDSATKTTKSKKSKSAKKAKTTSTAGLPSYEQVKQLALQAPEIKQQCAKGSEDRDIGAPSNGETYKRLFCGEREILDYVVGAEQYKENFAAAQDLAFAPLWSDSGKAYVKVSASGLKGLAGQIRSSCSCGQVVQPK